MNKVAQECQCASYNQSYGKPVNSGFHALACRSFGEGSFFMLEGENVSNTAFGFGGLTGGDDQSALQGCSSVVGSLNSSRAESTWSWSSPSRDLFASSDDSERVFGDEVFGSVPSDNDDVERVMNFNMVVGVDDLWTNYENPEDCCNSGSIHSADKSIKGLVYNQVGNGNYQADSQNGYEVKPVASCSVEIVAHDPNSTAPKNSFYIDLLVQKGK